jgi:SAM-dependent methyltransferase
MVATGPGLALDIGAGSGRDAAWLIGRGYEVVAVEPADGMIREGQKLHAGRAIRWLNDRLPGLIETHRLGLAFDLILMSAVWMHLPPGQDRERAFRKIVTLLKPGGVLLMTLRHGPEEPGRPMYPTSPGEIERLARAHGLVVVRCRPRNGGGRIELDGAREVAAALPVGADAPNDDIFGAVEWRRLRLQQDHQLNEWPGP